MDKHEIRQYKIKRTINKNSKQIKQGIETNATYQQQTKKTTNSTQ